MNRRARAPHDRTLAIGRIALLVLVVGAVAAVVWGPRLLRHPAEHVAAVINDAGAPLVQLRLRVGGRSFARDTLAAHASVRWPFRIREDTRFDLEWRRPDDPTLHRWQGGRVIHGPLVQRHELHVRDDDGVIVIVRPL